MCVCEFNTVCSAVWSVAAYQCSALCGVLAECSSVATVERCTVLYPECPYLCSECGVFCTRVWCTDLYPSVVYSPVLWCDVQSCTRVCCTVLYSPVLDCGVLYSHVPVYCTHV